MNTDDIEIEYREERRSLQHSCEGTSEAQRFQFEEAIVLLDLKHYAALQKTDHPADDLCDMYRIEGCFYLAFEGVDGFGNIEYFSDPEHLLAAIEQCNRGQLGWSLLDEESYQADEYEYERGCEIDGEEQYREEEANA